MLTTVEKVIFLQHIDIFEYTSTEDLAHVAAITEEVSKKENMEIYKEGGIADSMYMVIDGKVRLHIGDSDVMIAEHKDVFGTWSLFDDEPRVVTATTLAETNLLKIDKDDFIDLLAG